MEHYVAHAIEAILRNKDWETEIYQFYQVNSPRFMNFTMLYNRHINNENSMEDTGFDLQMIVVHKEFIKIVENKLSILLLNMNVAVVDFIQSMKLNLESNDETVCRLYNLVYMYDDFIEFSTMMELKYKEIFLHKINNNHDNNTAAAANKDTNDNDNDNNRSKSITFKSTIQTNNVIRICRVLWDIENIPVINKDGLYTVTKLHTFLKHIHMMGIGIDTRITAFLNPYNNSISKKVVDELNKASVELVCTSSKREDADRKLGMRINQEMLILNPALTTFIVISSDQDFRQHVQLLTNNGFQVIVIHNVITNNMQWKAAIEMYASQSYIWNDIMNITQSNNTEVTSTVTTKQQDKHVIRSLSNKHNLQNITNNIDENNQLLDNYSKQTIIHSDNNKSVSDVDNAVNIKNNNIKHLHKTHLLDIPNNNIINNNHNNNTHGYSNDILQKEALCVVGWRIAMCLRWKSAFGFLLIDISQPVLEESFTIPLQSNDNNNINAVDDQHTSAVDNNNNSNNDSNSNNNIILQNRQKSIPKYLQINKYEKSNTNIIKVYIHNSVLLYKPSTQKMLQTGEYVLAFIQLESKGPKAIIVKDIFASN